MAQNERFLTVDIGAAAIKLAEFEFVPNGGVQMTAFAHREYEEELSEDNRINVIEGVLRQMILETDIHTRKAMLSLSGQTSLIRFAQIPNYKNDRKQIRQLAEFEAKRNIPFALDEICLDFQLIAGMENEEGVMDNLDVLSVVVKKDVVEQIVHAVRTVGLTPMLVDVAPIACYNAARANGLGDNGSVMVVSIGGRSTNLLFLEKDHFFARTIPIAGHTITQQIARKFSIGQPEAEEMKRRHGFVAKTDASGTSEASGDVSIIIRNVMKRLHGEITRSIAIYKAQQHGSDPVKVYLTGGSTILTYCDQFFAEKFNLPVEYFNPLTCVSLSPEIDKVRLSEVGHTFSEVIGLALRYSSTCPVEINLLPKDIASQQSLVYKKPYFIASMFTLLVLFFLIKNSMEKGLAETQIQLDKYKAEWAKYEPAYTDIINAISEADSAKAQVDELQLYLMQRAQWPMVMEEIFRAKPDNVWIDSIEPVFGDLKVQETKSIVEEEANAMGGSGNDMMSMGMMGSSEMMDMGSMGGMDMMGGGGSSLPSLTAIGGFTIRAHAIKIYNPKDNRRLDPKLADEPKYPFEVPEKSDQGSEDEDEDMDSDEENEENEEEADDTPAGVAKADEPQNQDGDQLFLRNLLKSKLFSNEEGYTVVLTSLKSELIDNVLDFEIQLKLNLPLEAYPWDQASSNKGMMGGMNMK